MSIFNRIKKNKQAQAESVGHGVDEFTLVTESEMEAERQRMRDEGILTAPAPTLEGPPLVISPVIGKLINGRSATFYISGRPYAMSSEAPQWDELVIELSKADPDVDRLIALVDASKGIASSIEEVQALGESNESVRKALGDYLNKGVIRVTREGVTFDNEPQHNVLAERLMEVLAAGFRITPWVRFAENVYQNPAEFSQDELLLWLEKSDLPITDDGHFLAYKVVRHDFTDKHSGKFDNSPGQLVEMEGGRSAVDPVRDRTCSYGLHFCSKSYISSFISSGDRVVLVKVNPADVVSIPNDYDNAKGRAWRYEVLEEIPREDLADKRWSAVHTVTPVAPVVEAPAPVGPKPTAQPVATKASPVVKKANKARKGKALSAKKAEKMGVKELRVWLRTNRPTKGARVMTRDELIKAATS